MLSFLKTEWLKIRRYRTFWIQTGLFLLIFPLWNWGVQQGSQKLGSRFIGAPYSFPSVWRYIGFFGSVFVIFLCILTITLTCNETTFKTQRQNVIDGWSRLDFFHGKVALVLCGAIGATLFEVLIGILFGLSTGGLNHFGEGWEFVLYLFVTNLNYLGLALLTALFVKRSGLSIALFFLYSFILDILLASLINKSSKSQFGNFMPLQASDELLTLPQQDTLGTMIGNSAEITRPTYLFVSIAWIVIYYFVGRRLMLQRDY